MLRLHGYAVAEGSRASILREVLRPQQRGSIANLVSFSRGGWTGFDPSAYDLST